LPVLTANILLGNVHYTDKSNIFEGLIPQNVMFCIILHIEWNAVSFVSQCFLCTVPVVNS